MLCYVGIRGEWDHLEKDARLQRFSVLRIKAGCLRSKVLFFISINKVEKFDQAIPIPNSNSKALEAVEKARAAAKGMLEWNFPHREVTEAAIRLTVPIEMKYWKFAENDGSITKIREMERNEVKFYVANFSRQLLSKLKGSNPLT